MEKDNILKIVRDASPPFIEPSRDFDSRFWQKVSAHQKESWLVKILEQLQFLIPTPTLAQGVAILLIALMLGGGTGVVSAKSSPALSFSGFKEIKGIPLPSVSGAYFKMIQSGDLQ